MSSDPPLFLRFINLLVNDAIFLLDEALSVSSLFSFIRLLLCLPACLLLCLPACLSACLSTCLLACLSACLYLPVYLPVYLPAYLPGCLSVCVYHVYSRLLACLSPYPCWLACLSICLLACLPACLSYLLALPVSAGLCLPARSLPCLLACLLPVSVCLVTDLPPPITPSTLHLPACLLACLLTTKQFFQYLKTVRTLETERDRGDWERLNTPNAKAEVH